MRLFIIMLLVNINDAWDNSYLLPNIPIDQFGLISVIQY